MIYLAKESNLQSKCLKYLKDKGIVAFNIHGGGWSAKGAPDVICCIQGKFIAFEFKVGKNGMQPDQKIWKKRIENCGGKHYCPRTLIEFKDVVNELNRRENNGKR